MRGFSKLGCGFGSLRGWAAVALALLVSGNVGCHRKPSGPAHEPVAGQKTFATPDEAGLALAEAAASTNQQQMAEIFGPNSNSVLYSGDAAADNKDMANFVAAFHRMNRWQSVDNGTQSLMVGITNSIFPVPLAKDSKGQWFFETPAGAAELLARRIGRNEVAAIDICASLADAQEEYYRQDHGTEKQFARKLISDPGKDDGLYWPSTPGKPKSPIGPLLAYASDEGAKLNASLHKPFHGYYFGILTSQGFYANGALRDYVRNGVMTRGFGFIAWPAEYGKSGVMTFLVNRDRQIFQKDLGEKTAGTAPFMKQFNPEPGWLQVEQ
jgi:DUF2950 family protein